MAALGALGLAGICRETLRVIRSRPPGFTFVAGTAIALSLILLAHVAFVGALFSDAVASSADAGLLRLAAIWASFFLLEAACLLAIVVQLLGSAAFCVFSIAPSYGFTDDRDARSLARCLRAVPEFLLSIFRGDSRSIARHIRAVPKVAWRLVATSYDAFLVLLGYITLWAPPPPGPPIGIPALSPLLRLRRVKRGLQLPRTLQLLGDAAFLIWAAHIGTIWRVACVMSVLEDAGGVGAMQRSGRLLAGKFWAAAAIFSTLDGCALAVQLAFKALVVDDTMGLSVWLRVAAGVAMAAALWAAVMVGLVAQVVVYFVCKNDHRQRPRASP
ncbi:unnamed protein product [Triticum turgidum subsp. durum]|uniref:Uncharacterized protein n=1 Tax=Triticum turgidum subsp. durum TaxID=4567 RepID=A0A9R0YW91_TRITD|nr:unnamed protein product [Triticum turgidum subsp. durum]